jgi:hypothetical protein
VTLSEETKYTSFEGQKQVGGDLLLVKTVMVIVPITHQTVPIMEKRARTSLFCSAGVMAGRCFAWAA